MTVELQPETEQLVKEEPGSGRFQDIDELIAQSCANDSKEERGGGL